MKDSKERFSNRVDNYVKYRPSYPKEAIAYLYEAVGISNNSIIADVGAGTGIFTRLLLEQGSTVFAVEPNKEMRQAAEYDFSSYSHFISVEGSAEATTLPNHSVDFVVCAQAFHWFDIPKCKEEFNRILQPSGRSILIWNTRDTHGNPFVEQYDHLLKLYADDYKNVNHMNLGDKEFSAFFKEGKYQLQEFRNFQLFNYEQLQGRMMSSSYCPLPEDKQYEPLMNEMKELYEKHQVDDQVTFSYQTQIYYGSV